jgi:hypothetical protein
LFDSLRNNNALNEAVPDTGFLGSGGMQNKDSYDQGNDIPNTNTGQSLFFILVSVGNIWDILIFTL